MLIPAPEQLASELALMVRKGVTIDGLRSFEGLLEMALVKAKATTHETDDLAVSAQGLIAEAAVRVDGIAHGPAAVLLALAPGTRGSILKERRAQAAELLHVSTEHFRKDREDGLIEAVADELYGLDSAFRLRHQHRMEGERTPEESGLRIDWLAQHQTYRRIWTPVTGMRNDVLVLMSYVRDKHKDHADIADRLVNISWRYAQFSRELERFIQEQGGLWLLADPESEQAAADAIYRIDWHTPLGEADVSWLRLLLERSEGQELDPFGDLLIAAGKRRQELMGVWMGWVEACSLNPDEADRGCELHRWLDACQDFIRLIDKDWLRVADWYREVGASPKNLRLPLDTDSGHPIQSYKTHENRQHSSRNCRAQPPYQSWRQGSQPCLASRTQV